MILTVTLNPAVDMTITVDELILGESHRVEPAAVRAGGKGVNVARVLRRQGIEAVALTFVGDSVSGRAFAAGLEQDGVLHHLVRTPARVRTSVAIVDTRNSRATVFNERGTHPGESALRELLSYVETEPDVDVIVVSGSLPDGVSATTVAEIVAIARGRGIPVVVDAAGAVLLAAADAGASLLKPNAAELRQASPDSANPCAAARSLIARGAGSVVVTLGEAGMIHVQQDSSFLARLPRPLRGNPTGAGDAATAALAAALTRGARPDEYGLRLAVAWSAAAVLAPTGGEIDGAWRELLTDVQTRPVTEEWRYPWPL